MAYNPYAPVDMARRPRPGQIQKAMPQQAPWPYGPPDDGFMRPRGNFGMPMNTGPMPPGWQTGGGLPPQFMGGDFNNQLGGGLPPAVMQQFQTGGGLPPKQIPGQFMQTGGGLPPAMLPQRQTGGPGQMAQRRQQVAPRADLGQNWSGGVGNFGREFYR